MVIELRLYKERYNMDPSYYSGTECVYETRVYPDIDALHDDWASMMRFYEGETYSAWIEDRMVCGGALDPGDYDYIEAAYIRYGGENA